MHQIYYILITGLILLIVIFIFIMKQNAVLMKEDKTKGYTAYNQKKGSPDGIMQYWKQSANRITAVKSIIYLDYLLMLIYGALIVYGLYFFAQHQSRNWLKYIFFAGMACIAAGVVCDAIQDSAIFQHLTKDKFTDFRNLTQFKFTCILFSVAALVTAIIYFQIDLAQ